MRALRSIRARFTAWYLLVLGILLVCLSISLYLFMSHTLRRDIDDGLSHRAAQISSIRNVRSLIADGRFEEVLGEIVGFYTHAEGGYTVASTHLIEELIDAKLIEQAFSGERVFVTIPSPEGQRLRFYIAPFRPAVSGTPGGVPPAGAAPEGERQPAPGAVLGEVPAREPAVLVIAQPMDRIIAALGALQAILAIAVPLTLVLSAWGGLFLVRRALRPVDQMIATTREIEETDLARRVVIRADDELGRLARTLNAMLDRLQSAFRRQRQFTDDASHELRSPLSVIEAEATLALRRERSAADYRDAIATIAEEARTMNRLIDQLLTLARSDAGEEKLEPEPVDMAAIAQETVAAMQPVADEKAVRLVAEASVSGVVDGDPIRLRRVMANLVDNAIRHTPKNGSVRVAVSSTKAEVRIEVADTGAGIPEKDLPHIFERFYRVDKARSRTEGGSGLGLAICRTIVAVHGGSIDVASEEGVGSCFVVRLPSEGTTAG